MYKTLLASLFAVASLAAVAQTNCTRIGNQVFCESPSGSVTTNRIGNSNLYSYSDQEKARRQGLPSSSTDIGNTRFYDNGVTRSRVGNTDFYSNGTTATTVGNTKFYSDGRTCTTVGSSVFCN